MSNLFNEISDDSFNIRTTPKMKDTSTFLEVLRKENSIQNTGGLNLDISGRVGFHARQKIEQPGFKGAIERMKDRLSNTNVLKDSEVEPEFKTLKELNEETQVAEEIDEISESFKTIDFEDLFKQEYPVRII